MNCLKGQLEDLEEALAQAQVKEQSLQEQLAKLQADEDEHYEALNDANLRNEQRECEVAKQECAAVESALASERKEAHARQQEAVESALAAESKGSTLGRSMPPLGSSALGRSTFGRSKLGRTALDDSPFNRPMLGGLTQSLGRSTLGRSTPPLGSSPFGSSMLGGWTLGSSALPPPRLRGPSLRA